MAKLVSKTYGEALFEIAEEENKVDVFWEEVLGIMEILKENAEFGKLMNHPKISKEEKIKTLENVFRGRISDEITGFMTLIVSKERYGDLDDIFLYFIDKVKETKGIGVAHVATAVELKSAQKQQIEEKLLQTTEYREMEMHYAVDTDLIGGMVIRIKDHVVDSSIRTKLNELQKQLYKIQLV